MGWIGPVKEPPVSAFALEGKLFGGMEAPPGLVRGGMAVEKREKGDRLVIG